MNLKRVSLYLVVAILTFVIGLSASMLFGAKLNPFSSNRQSRRSCARLTALPDHRSRITVYTVYRPDGTVVKSYEVDKTYGLERLGTITSEEATTTPAQITSVNK